MPFASWVSPLLWALLASLLILFLPPFYYLLLLLLCVCLHEYCVSYFLIAVMKLHGQDNIQKEGSVWAYGSGKLRSKMRGTTWQLLADLVAGPGSQELKAYISNYKHKTGIAS